MGTTLKANIFQAKYFSKQKAQAMTGAFCYLLPNVGNLLKINDLDNGRLRMRSFMNFNPGQ